MNDFHKIKNEGEWIRPRRTRAKEQVYKQINMLIREIKPNFNIGVSTKTRNGFERFVDPYRHWIFKPKEAGFTISSKNKKRFMYFN